MLDVGSSAPSFRARDAEGKVVTLADLKGRWSVLYFYAKDDTPGCTTEACEFTDAIPRFEGLDATIVGVSPDSPESHAKFVKKHGLKVTLLSDPEHAMLEKYGAWGEKTLYGRTSIGVIRSTVLLDPKGKVAHVWPRVKAKG